MPKNAPIRRVEPILYDRDLAAEALSMSKTTLDAYRKVGAIKSVRKGGKIMFNRTALERFSVCDHPSPFSLNAHELFRKKRTKTAAA